MKPSKTTLIFLVVTAAVALFDLVFAAIATWVLIGKANGTMLVPEWFFPFCIAGAVVNGIFFVFSSIYFILNKR